MPHDADAFRAGMEIIGCLAPPEEVLSRPGFADHVRAVAAGRVPAGTMGPDRDELLRLVA
jgi:hypothetical protein